MYNIFLNIKYIKILSPFDSKFIKLTNIVIFLTDDVLEDLYIEYNTAFGGSNIVQREAKTNIDIYTRKEETNTTLYRLVHINDVMSSLPSNICEIENIKLINLTRNRITTLNGIECVYHLDTLDL